MKAVEAIIILVIIGAVAFVGISALLTRGLRTYRKRHSKWELITIKGTGGVAVYALHPGEESIKVGEIGVTQEDSDIDLYELKRKGKALVKELNSK